MSATPSPLPVAYASPTEPYYPGAALRVVATIALVIIAAGIIVGLVTAFFQGRLPTFTASTVPSEWIVGAIVLAVSVVIVTSIFRVALWGLWGSPYPYRYWRRYYRHHYAAFPFDYDPALGIARERYARGEITQEQFDIISRQLYRGSGPLPP